MQRQLPASGSRGRWGNSSRRPSGLERGHCPERDHRRGRRFNLAAFPPPDRGRVNVQHLGKLALRQAKLCSERFDFVLHGHIMQCWSRAVNSARGRLAIIFLQIAD